LYLLYIHFSNKHRLLKLIKKYKKSSGCINKGDAKKLATEIKKRYHRLKQKDKLKYLHLFQGLIKNKKF